MPARTGLSGVWSERLEDMFSAAEGFTVTITTRVSEWSNLYDCHCVSDERHGTFLTVVTGRLSEEHRARHHPECLTELWNENKDSVPDRVPMGGLTSDGQHIRCYRMYRGQTAIRRVPVHGEQMRVHEDALGWINARLFLLNFKQRVMATSPGNEDDMFSEPPLIGLDDDYYCSTLVNYSIANNLNPILERITTWPRVLLKPLVLEWRRPRGLLPRRLRPPPPKRLRPKAPPPERLRLNALLASENLANARDLKVPRDGLQTKLLEGLIAVTAKTSLRKGLHRKELITEGLLKGPLVALGLIGVLKRPLTGGFPTGRLEDISTGGFRHLDDPSTGGFLNSGRRDVSTGTTQSAPMPARAMESTFSESTVIGTIVPQGPSGELPKFEVSVWKARLERAFPEAEGFTYEYHCTRTDGNIATEVLRVRFEPFGIVLIFVRGGRQEVLDEWRSCVPTPQRFPRIGAALVGRAIRFYVWEPREGQPARLTADQASGNDRHDLDEIQEIRPRGVAFFEEVHGWTYMQYYLLGLKHNALCLAASWSMANAIERMAASQSASADDT
ncbi:hypothetical protein BO71DRAFT_488488 [Aspergillus ellipticus CBS 707.79]|uniref:Uncharacterized protein n=1 Tax=Aspergillus ellipticus CBS 707.79 TaxID=1448320 RepID=A0A319ECJ2_9EURO|nr:hypothetical protein BO71DRAFT_488488 [Aspergillus ellipticus CBS 707.79]